MTTIEEQIDRIFQDFKAKRISREEAIQKIMALSRITRVGADDILNRWPTIKQES